MPILNSYHEGDLFFHHICDEIPNPSEFGMHYHTFCEIYYFISGKGSFFIEGREYELKSGDVLIMDSGEVHCIAIDPSEQYERLALHFRKELIRAADPEGVLLRAFEEREFGRRNLLSAKDFKDSVYAVLLENIMNPQVSDKRLHTLSNIFALLNEIRIAFENAGSVNLPERDSTAFKIIGYINSRINKPLSLDEICEQFYISKAQLCRVFKKVTGTTVWNYVKIKRLSNAREQILLGQPATKAFAECGFHDYSAFFRAYKKHFGCSPCETSADIQYNDIT